MEHHFAECVLDDARLTLVRAGASVPVEPKVFDLIHLLVRRAGELVTREMLVDEIWDGRIVSESAISACISAARKAVGDDGKRQTVIRTVARRGLMLVAEVSNSTGSVTTPETVPAPETQRIRYCRTDRGQGLAYAVSGVGPPVLRFGPPLTTDLQLEWDYGLYRTNVSSMSAHTSLMRFDHAGSGQSERCDPVLDFSELARDAAKVPEALGFERFAAASFSGGCLTAVHFAALYPERLTRLAIVGGYVEGRSRRNVDAGSDALKAMIEEGWARPESAFASAFITSYFPEGPPEAAREVLRQMQATCSPETMLKDRDAINGASIEHLLGKVRCPVLILHARDDAVHPLSQAQKLAAGIADSELVVLETANHVPLYGSRCWEAYNRILAEFLLG